MSPRRQFVQQKPGRASDNLAQARLARLGEKTSTRHCFLVQQPKPRTKPCFNSIQIGHNNNQTIQIRNDDKTAKKKHKQPRVLASLTQNELAQKLGHLSPPLQQLHEQIEELEIVAQKGDQVYYCEPQHRTRKKITQGGFKVMEQTYVQERRVLN